MSDYREKIAEQELVNSNMALMAPLIGIVVIFSIWFLFGLWYVTSI